MHWLAVSEADKTDEKANEKSTNKKKIHKVRQGRTPEMRLQQGNGNQLFSHTKFTKQKNKCWTTLGMKKKKYQNVKLGNIQIRYVTTDNKQVCVCVCEQSRGVIT